MDENNNRAGVKMNILYLIDEMNYNHEWNRFSREAVRAVIIKNKKIALLKSKIYGFYKFPGGGVEKGESLYNALIRETYEETGLAIIRGTISEFGIAHEIRKSTNYNEIFDEKSYYYFADVEKTLKQNINCYDDMVKDATFELELMNITTVIDINISVGEVHDIPFLKRDTFIFTTKKRM